MGGKPEHASNGGVSEAALPSYQPLSVRTQARTRPSHKARFPSFAHTSSTATHQQASDQGQRTLLLDLDTSTGHYLISNSPRTYSTVYKTLHEPFAFWCVSYFLLFQNQFGPGVTEKRFLTSLNSAMILNLSEFAHTCSGNLSKPVKSKRPLWRLPGLILTQASATYSSYLTVVTSTA